MSEIEFWLLIAPSQDTLIAVGWDCMRAFGVLWFLLALMSVFEAPRPEPVPEPAPEPKRKLSPRERRRAKRQRFPDGTKRRWRKGQRAPR